MNKRLEERFESIYENRNNGNISTVREELKRMNKKTLVKFVLYLSTFMDDYQVIEWIKEIERFID